MSATADAPLSPAPSDVAPAADALTGSPYRRALDVPGARPFYAAASVARLGAAMTGLSLVWLVHGTTGSYGSAGLTTGAYAVSTALGSPQVARVVDRLGQTRTLPVQLAVYGATLALLVAAATTHRPLGLIVAAAALAGASIPQVAALSAARWTHLLEGRGELAAAFSLESMSNAASFLVGPVLVSTLSSSLGPAAGTVTAGALLLGGGAFLTAQGDTAPGPMAATAASKGSERRLLGSRFSVLVAINLGTGAFFGALQVATTAFAEAHGSPALAGPLYGVMSAATLLSGLLYGRRHWPMAPERQVVWALAALATACLPLLLVGQPWQLALVVTLPGFALTPVMVLTNVLTKSFAPPEVVTQAFSWLSSAGAAGLAGSAAISGQLTDHLGSRAGFGVALAAVFLTALVAAATLRHQPAGRATAN